MITMEFRRAWRPASAFVAAAWVVGCSRPTQTGMHAAAAPLAIPTEQTTQSAIAKAKADSVRLPYTAADVAFMSGMIAHHSQAIVMAGWAKSHGASEAVQTLCARIINAQTDEIVAMQRWLRDRNQPVPEANPNGMRMTMGGMTHDMLMPGMLTEAQMNELNASKGADFDRLFLQFMIQHHRGAISMVHDLFATYGAAQDDLIFKFASDVNVDQTTEIARMQKMLAAAVFGASAPER